MKKFLVLGSDRGWHADQMRAAATRLGCRLDFQLYETMSAGLTQSGQSRLTTAGGDVAGYQAILTRTMPAGSFESITFRLAMLHGYVRGGGTVINSPASLEIAIDKYATLVEVGRLGYPIPETRVVQSRDEALAAFDELGGDCVVKPIFGGEGRGVMRVRDRQLAWTVFSTLQQLSAVAYVQRFVPPGGSDTRLLVMGKHIHAIRRTSSDDFRTNVSTGGRCERVELTSHHHELARRITGHLGLTIASVDLLDRGDGKTNGQEQDYCIVEVNGIPGWRGAQKVMTESLAEQFMDAVRSFQLQPPSHQPANVQPSQRSDRVFA